MVFIVIISDNIDQVITSLYAYDIVKIEPSLSHPSASNSAPGSLTARNKQVIMINDTDPVG